MTLPPPLDWREAGIGPGADVPPERRVTRDNWRLYPFSRWAFQHARELVPSRPLPRGPAHGFAEGAVDFSSIEVEDGEGERLDWATFLERTYTDAFLVLHRGALAFEYYANGVTAATPHMGFSITKSIVGLVAERAIADGLFNAEARVGDHVPGLVSSAFADATARQLLDMTDGVGFDENYADPDAEVHRYSAAYWNPAAGLGGTLGALSKMQTRLAEGGASFKYRTPVADVLGLMLRSIAGAPLAELVARYVWTPAGCCDEAYMLLDTSGTEITGTGLNATARDLARVGLWLLDQRALLAEIRAGGDRDLFATANYAQRPNGSYRSFWWIDHDRPPTIAANGVFGQRLWLDPENALVVVRFGSHPVASNSFTDLVHRNAFAAIQRLVATR